MLLHANDEAKKEQVSERLLNVLIDLWQTNGPALYRYRGYTIFTTPGPTYEWRLGVYPDRMIVEVK